MALLSCWLQESLFLGTPFGVVFQGGADFLGFEVKISARRLDQQGVLDWPSQAGLGRAEVTAVCQEGGMLVAATTHVPTVINTKPGGTRVPAWPASHTVMCNSTLMGVGGGGGTCLTLMESVKVFFLDIKGSKSHKCEKQAPPIFL